MSGFNNLKGFSSVKITQIYIYISFACFSAKGFSILRNTSFADLTASVMPALSNPFRIDSFCCFRQVYISTIQRAYRGFMSNILTDTFASPGATPFFNCSLTRSMYHEFMGDELLYFLIDRNTKMLEIVAQIMRYNNQLAIIFQMQYFNFNVILTFEGTDHHL